MSSFTFYKDSARTAAADLSDAKVMIYKDGGDNEYILDASGVIGLKKIDDLRLSSLKDITIKYQPKGNNTGIAVEGLGSIMDKLFATQSAENEKTFFEGIVAKKPIVEAILNAKDPDINDKISNLVLENTFARKADVSANITKKLETKADKAELDRKADADNVYTKKDIDGKLETKADADSVYTKEDADKKFFPLAEQRKLAQEMLEKHTDKGESILVKTLGKFLDENYALYGNDRDQTAKDFLAKKGEFTKIDGSNIEIPNFTNKILDATQDVEGGKKKSVLVEKLGKFLDQTTDNDKAYEGKIAKDFLGEKGMQGPNGAQGPTGRDGESPSANDVAVQLLTVKNRNALVNEVAGNEGLQEAVAGNQGLRTAVTANLSGDNGFQESLRGPQGLSGVSPDIREIAAQLVTEKSEELGRTVLDTTDSNGNNLATQVANQINVDQQSFLSKVNEVSFTEGIVNRLNLEDAKRIIQSTVNTIVSDATSGNNPNPEAFKKYEKFAEKLAELLVDKSNISEQEADVLVENKVNGWALARYLILRSGLDKSTSALPVVQEKVNREKLAEYLLEYAELKSVDNAKTVVQNTVDYFFSQKAIELGQAVLEAKDDQNREILVNSSILQEGVAKKLRENPGRTKGPEGDKGEGLQGPAGRDGESPSANDIAAQLLNGENKDKLANEVASNEGLQEAVAGNQGLRTAVTNTLKGDGDFHNIVKGDPGKDGENPSANDVAAQLLTVKNRNALVNEVAGNEGLQEAVAGNQGLRTAVTNTLKGDGDFQAVVKGDPGKDGENPSANDVADRLLNGENKDKLANEVASNEGLQEAVAGNQGLRTAVTTILSGDNDFHSIVKRDLNRDGESLSVDDVVTKLFDDKEKRLVNAIGDDKEVAEKILGATEGTDGKKSILVERLAGFLDIGDQAYDDNTRTAKEFLNSKGLTPSADALVTAAIAEDTNFMDNVKTMAVSNNSVFQEAVREVMSKPFFEIPDDPNQPLSWDW